MHSLDPDDDPLCMLLLLDFYALRSEQYDFLVRICTEWEGHRNLLQLPNFAFSVPLAKYHQAVRDGTDQQEADNMVTVSIICTEWPFCVDIDDIISDNINIC